MNSGIPLISVLMTVYNKSKFLHQAINSVLSSTFEDFELIIVDDGSTDDSLKIVQEFAAIDSRIQLHVNDVNLGDYHNRNKAASFAIGKYIKYLDADDVLYPWTLAVMSRFMERHPNVAYGLDSLDPDIAVPFPLVLDPEQTYHRHYNIAPVFHKAPSSCIINREIFWHEGGFSGKRFVGDFEFWMKLSRNYHVLLMPQGMVWSREHEGQESKLIWSNSLVVFQYLLAELLALQHNGCPLPSESRRRLVSRVRRAMARSALRSLLIERNLESFRQKKKGSGLGYLELLFISLKPYA